MFQQEKILSDGFCPIIFESFDELSGIDVKIRKMGISQYEIKKLSQKLMTLRDQTPTGSQIHLYVENMGNGKFYGNLRVTSMTFRHESIVNSSNYRRVLRDLLEDTYEAIRQWRKFRMVS